MVDGPKKTLDNSSKSGGLLASYAELDEYTDFEKNNIKGANRSMDLTPNRDLLNTHCSFANLLGPSKPI